MATVDYSSLSADELKAILDEKEIDYGRKNSVVSLSKLLEGSE